MIPNVKVFKRAKRMFFELIRKKISFLNSQKPDSIRKEGDLDQFKSRKNKAEYLALDQASCLVKNKEFEKALKVINQTLNNGIKTNKLLFQKAWILSKINHYEIQFEAAWALTNIASNFFSHK